MAAVRQVLVGNFFFRDEVSNNSTSTINVGDTIRWVWQGGTHTTTSVDWLWDEEISANRRTFEYTFTQPGTYPYYCIPHPDHMRGTIVVNETLTEISPSSFEVWRGVYISGTLEDLLESDDRRVVIEQRYPFTPMDPNAGIIARATSNIQNPSKITLLVEVSSNFGPASNSIQLIEAYNFSEMRWITLDQRETSSHDSTITLEITQGASNYVEPGTRSLAMRVGVYDRGAFLPSWRLSIDWIRWRTRG